MKVLPVFINKATSSGGPCHHGRAHPQVVTGEDSLQVWSVTAYILTKQSQTHQGVVIQLGSWAGD